MLINDVNLRLLNSVSWKNGYVPYPSTYLNQKEWEGEVLPTVIQEPNKPKTNLPNQSFSNGKPKKHWTIEEIMRA